MRPSRLISIVMAALMAAFLASGCAHTSATNTATAVGRDPPPVVTAANLDSIAYERRGAAPAMPVQTRADAQPQGPQPVQAPATPAAMQAHAQAVVPVVGETRPQPPYQLDTGDKLRIVVFGQEGLSNSYFVDAAGCVTVPLIGAVAARGLTTQQLARAVAAKLRAGYIREPHVAIEVETYRPFFILGEVLQPGQYPYVPNMTVETAVAIAGGFTPRAYRYDVKIDRPTSGATARSRASVPLPTRVQPGDTIVIKERWF
jgi:polysaccharide export outer membrane protein